MLEVYTDNSNTECCECDAVEHISEVHLSLFTPAWCCRSGEKLNHDGAYALCRVEPAGWNRLTGVVRYANWNHLYCFSMAPMNSSSPSEPLLYSHL